MSNICRGLYLGGLIMVPSEGSFGSILLTSIFVLSRFMWATRNMSSKRWRVNLISWINWLSLARSSSRTLFNNKSVSMKYTDLAWDNHLFIKKDAIKIHRKINIDYESAVQYRKWSLVQYRKWSPTANDPETASDPQNGPQMILDRKWSPKSTANDPERKIGMTWTQVSGSSCRFYYYYNKSG